MRVLGVIPARGGSKGVPGKNIRPLHGLPLIGHTIAAARTSRLARVVLSTDDAEISRVGRELGAEVPFVRPPELATDKATSLPVMQHALAACEAERGGERYDAVMMLQPTTPLRLASDIDRAIAMLEESGADSVISVVDVLAHHPARMKYLEGDRLIDPPFCEAYENQPRQELRPMFIRNGAIYLTRREVLLGGSFKGRDCRGLVMPAERSVNIDTLDDFRHAEWVLAGGSTP
jgi:CMP-N-acetylneuraminic acid synthetase